MKLGSDAAHIIHVHLHYVEQSNPLRIDVTLVEILDTGFDARCLEHGDLLNRNSSQASVL
jgi:hypothetical protein